jgi:hypothetical protein
MLVWPGGGRGGIHDKLIDLGPEGTRRRRTVQLSRPVELTRSIGSVFSGMASFVSADWSRGCQRTERGGVEGW